MEHELDCYGLKKDQIDRIVAWNNACCQAAAREAREAAIQEAIHIFDMSEYEILSGPFDELAASRHPDDAKRAHEYNRDHAWACLMAQDKLRAALTQPSGPGSSEPVFVQDIYLERQPRTLEDPVYKEARVTAKYTDNTANIMSCLGEENHILRCIIDLVNVKLGELQLEYAPTPSVTPKGNHGTLMVKARTDRPGLL